MKKSSSANFGQILNGSIFFGNVPIQLSAGGALQIITQSIWFAETFFLMQVTEKFNTLSGADGLAITTLTVLGSALVYRDYYQTKTESHFHDRLLRRLKAQEISIDEVLALEYMPREIISYLRRIGALTVQQEKSS